MARSNASTPGTTAPVVRINDTDVVHVADSDESIDAQERRLYTSNKLVLDGDVVVPLDGEIEDNAMQARELGDNGDTSEDQETPQQLQDRLEERFLNAATPCTESRTDAEINTSQVDSSALEELPLRRGARGFPQRLRSQAGKLRSRLRGIQRPSFSLPERQKTDNKMTKTTKVEKPKVVKPKGEKSRFSLPDRPKFSMPERPKFNFPDRAKFSMPERPKFSMKRPNINLPTLGRVRKPLKERQNSSESNSSAKRNIFDFSTYPRLFDRKSKNRGEYATSSPKASRGQSPEVATVPRVKKKAPIGARWVQKFSDLKFADDEPESAVERSKPWRHPSIEEPQVAFRREATESRERLPWEESDDRSIEPPAPPPPLPDEIADEESREDHGIRDREEDEDVDYEEDSADIENRRIIVALPLGQGLLQSPEDELAAHIVEEVPDPRLYPRGLRGESLEEEMRRRGAKDKWRHESDEEMAEERPEKVEIGGRDPYGHDEYSGEMVAEDGYGGEFMPIDPPMKYVLEREQTPEDSSMRSDREQQSSGSSSDRRRRGVLEEIDSDEFFLRAKGISQDDMNLGRFLASEIRDAFRPTANALADQELDLHPPTRPVRTRSLRKKRRDETPPESYDATPPARPKRDRRRSEDSVRVDEYESYLPERTGSVSGSRHRVMYQTEAVPRAVEPLDDIVVVKPARRKSRSVARSCSDFGSDVLPPRPTPPTPPVAPRRRKRGRRNIDANGNGPYLNGHGPTTAVCNGHRRDVEWSEGIDYPPEVSNEPENLNREQLQTLVNRLDHEYIEPAPIAPKRRSRSRGTSVADDDRTSRGAESLPEVSYLDEEDGAGQETDSRDLPGYAVVDKREKPPRPPPPRRRREKFATSPRTPPSTAIPTVPVRPTRAYSTLGPAARRRSPSEDRSVNQMDVTPYTELDSDDPDCNDLQSGQVVNKIQGRPLPAPPRPPRSRRDAPDQVSTISNGLGEVAASTQTDPLPDDVVIEEEVTRARLVMTPSRAGSQILVSTERVASPTFGRNSPAVPPLPQSVHSERFVEPSEEAETGTPDPRGPEERPERPATPARPTTSLLPQQDERIRIASLEVGDLRVERLNVSQLEAHKISASEVDAIVVSASEMSNNSNTSNAQDAGIHPSLLRELIAIRSHLEQAALARQGPDPTPESSRVQTFDEEVMDQPLSAVDELIEALKKSDRNDEGTEIMEESERIDEQVETKDEKTLHEAPTKPVEEELQSISKIEIVQEVSQRDETKTEVTEDIKVRDESPASADVVAVKPDDKTPEKDPEVECTGDSVSTVKTSSVESALTPPTIIKNCEPVKAQVSPNLSESDTVSNLNADQEEIRTQGQSSLRDESKDEKRKCPRSRSSSPTIDGIKAVRQTASPVKSLPPLISVTPDTPDPVPSPIPEVQAQPQRATVSYTQSIDEEVSLRQQVAGVTQFVAFPTSQIPANFFSLASPMDSRYESEPSIMDTTQQLLRALRLAGTRAMRHFVGYVASRVSTEDRGEKTKEIELAICALLLLIAGLLILCFGSPRTVTHHHHWDYFNPPQ
ncbi:titin isoform X2 [Diprion similis]|nr:titin isoform X2 [Diprion similis]